MKNDVKWKNSMNKNYNRNSKKTDDYELVIDQGCIGSFSIY